MVRAMVVTSAACAAALSLAFPAAAAPVTVAADPAARAIAGLSFDPSFATRGTARCCGGVAAPAGEADFSAVAVRGQTVYAAGTTRSPGQPVTRAVVAAYGEDGTPLPSFNRGRPRTVRAAGRDSRPVSVLVRPDGRVVLVGLTRYWREHHRIFVVQLTPSGALDTGFSGDGRVVLPVRRAVNVAAGIDRDGRLYVAASVAARRSPDVDPVADVRVWRIRAGGRVDPTYGRHGCHVVDQRRFDDLVALAVTPRGTLTLALMGMSFKQFGEGERPPLNPPAMLVQLTPRGRTDRAFSADGRLEFRIQPRGGTAPVSLQRDERGRLLVGVMSSDYIGVRRWTPQGSADPTFGRLGVTRAIQYPAGFMPMAGTLTPRGYVMVGFDFSYGRATWFVRFLPDGGLDPAFGPGGQGVTQLWPFLRYPMEVVQALLVDDQGRLLVAGAAGSGSTSDSWAALSRMTMS